MTRGAPADLGALMADHAGVLQIEAIGEAGVLLHALLHARDGDDPRRAITLTHVRAARFMSPLRPGDDVEILTLGLNDGLFVTVAGQCLVRGAVASAML